ncbi:50S ribosomal protein L21 [Candidatus Microgenomates bacterium]|nr:MAG: 50S ribosomal protein L21 [Candidatus Microgenomates bacterium]
MKYAVIKTGGKQYKVSEGDVIEVERLTEKPESKFSFDDVLLYVNENTFKVGKPMLDDVAVKAKVLEEKRGEKIRVAKFKAKVRYQRVTGHRQALSKVLIEEIAQKGEKKEESKKKLSK